jgi:hypothetical protein
MAEVHLWTKGNLVDSSESRAGKLVPAPCGGRCPTLWALPPPFLLWS